MALAKKLLQQRWVHSHEEDTDTEKVYRPGDYDFPPSRGRESFQLKAGGQYLQRTPGPSDVPVGSEARWELADEVITVYAANGTRLRSFKVAALSRDRLVLKKS